MDKLLNPYVWQARIYPALLVILPIVISVIAWVPKVEDVTKPLISVLVAVGAVGLLAHFARDAGKKAEDKLLAEWGGFPSTAMLRHRDSRIEAHTKRRYHATLSEKVPGIQLPTQEEEEADPEGADKVYDSCGVFLRAKVRDEAQFPQLLAENIAYGARRNLFAMRVVGIAMAVLGVAACVWKLVYDYHKHGPMAPLSLLCLVLSVGLVVVWMTMIRKNWVRQAADDYAERLLETIDRL